MAEMTSMEYEFLTGGWKGPKGAAYNQVYEFCKEFGWINHYGVLTFKGKQAVEEYNAKS